MNIKPKLGTLSLELKTYDDEIKIFLKILFKKSWTILNNSRDIVMEWMSPPHPIVVNNILYIYFVEKWGALKINNYKKNPIVIYDNRLFEES